VGHGVSRAYLVAVSCACGKAGVVERRAGRRTHWSERRAACPRTALNFITGDGYIVGRRGPGEIDLRGRDNCGAQSGWDARWRGVTTCGRLETDDLHSRGATRVLGDRH